MSSIAWPDGRENISFIEICFVYIAVSVDLTWGHRIGGVVDTEMVQLSHVLPPLIESVYCLL